MKLHAMSDSFNPATLKRPQSPHSLRLLRLMEEQQREEIAERLRALRNGSKESNDSIAAYVGVRGRSVAGWMRAEHGPTYEHIVKVAELFDVDVTWLWTGREKGETPDLMGQLNGSLSEKLDRIEDLAQRILDAVAPIAAARLLAAGGQAKPESRSPSARERASSAKKPRAAKRRAG